MFVIHLILVGYYSSILCHNDGILAGPALPEMNSIWFKLWLYHKLQCGPPSLLLTRGTRLTKLPKPFKVRYIYL